MPMHVFDTVARLEKATNDGDDGGVSERLDTTVCISKIVGGGSELTELGAAGLEKLSLYSLRQACFLSRFKLNNSTNS